jgi:hypothetical protein
MKPTWEGWNELYAAQNADVSMDPATQCVYRARWNVHSGVDWNDYINNKVYKIIWTECQEEFEDNDLHMIAELSLNVNGDTLWHNTNQRPNDPAETDWYPVEYPGIYHEH